MRISLRGVAIIVLSLCTTACGSDATGTFGLVTLCPQATWAAIQREGQPWQAIPGTRGLYPIGAGERIGLARIRGAVFPDSLQIYYVTSEQAAATFSCDTPPTGSTPPTKDLHGTLQGIGAPSTDPDALGGGGVTITLGNSHIDVATGNFTFPEAPGGPTDLVATALDVGRSTIIRRGVNYPDGSAIPVLDFSSAEAFGLQVNTATVGGNTNNNNLGVMSRIITQRTMGMLRYQFPPPGSTTAAMFSVPESKLLDGELNAWIVYDGFSFVTVYYRTPSDRAVELGPMPPLPTVNRSGISPDFTTRIDEASQPEYGAQITLRLSLPLNATANPKPTIAASREYFGGTPATWSFTVPDFRGVGDFPASFGDLRSSGLLGMEVTDRPYLAPPRDGITYRSGLR